jgi:hypothetical protein
MGADAGAHDGGLRRQSPLPKHFGPTASVMNLPPRQAQIALQAKPVFFSLPQFFS